MEVMNRRDERLFDKLVRLAGGDTGIVMHVLSEVSRRHRSCVVDLREVVAGIEHERMQMEAQARSAALRELSA